jgi:hypothetical protein
MQSWAEHSFVSNYMRNGKMEIGDRLEKR